VHGVNQQQRSNEVSARIHSKKRKAAAQARWERGVKRDSSLGGQPQDWMVVFHAGINFTKKKNTF